MSELVPIKEAATRLGVSADTIRRRLKRGELTGEQQETAQGFTWLVELPDAAPPTHPQPAGEVITVQPGNEAPELITLRAENAMLERERTDLVEQRNLWQESYVEEARRREDAERRRDDADKRRDEAELELRNILLSRQAAPMQLAGSIEQRDEPAGSATDQQEPRQRTLWDKFLGR